MPSESEIRAVQEAFNANGFEIYLVDGLRRYFDFIAKREDATFIIKCLRNIDNLGDEAGCELLKLSNAFLAQPLLIGELAGISRLEDGLVYSRHQIPSLTISTAKAIINGDCISKFTSRGRTLVGIEGSTLREMRTKRGMSREELAKALSCSGQTIYRMEKQNRAEEEIFERILNFFGKEIQVPAIQITDGRTENEHELSDPIKKRIVGEYLRLKLENTAFSNPLDFALDEKALFTPVSRTESELRNKQKIAKSLETALDCKTVHITKEKKTRRLLAISFDELHAIASKEEILERID